MIKYIIKRLFMVIPTLIILSIIIFSIVHLAPGGPIEAMFGYNVKPEDIAKINEFYGLDDPLPVQYFHWIKKMVSLDFGESIVRGDKILPMILVRLPRTLVLTLMSMVIALTITFPLAIISAKEHGKAADLIISGISLTFISMPQFYIAIILIIIFGLVLRILPTTSYTFAMGTIKDFLKVTILPATAIGLTQAAGITRMLRAEMVDNLNREYITFAKAKGASDGRVLIFHNLRNSLIATSTFIGMGTGYLLGGVVIIEKVFTFPGMGQLLLDSVERRDYPVIQETVLIFCFIFIIINLVTDLLYAVLDPRIRYK